MLHYWNAEINNKNFRMVAPSSIVLIRKIPGRDGHSQRRHRERTLPLNAIIWRFWQSLTDVFQTDSDRQTYPAEFQQFRDLRQPYRTWRRSAARHCRKDAVPYILKVVFRASILDSNAPFRLMAASCLNNFFNGMPGNCNLPNVMFTVFGACYHRNIR